MLVGLDIGRQFVKSVLLEKTKSGFKALDAGIRPVTEPGKAFDPEMIKKPLWVMAIKELLNQQKLKPSRLKNLVTGINGTSTSIKQISTLEMPTEELQSAMTFEARKHIPMDGTDAVIDFQILGTNPREVDKIDVVLVACTKKVLAGHMEILREAGIKPGKIDADAVALANAFAHHHEFPEEGVVILLDVGAVSSTVVVRGKNDPYFTRDIPMGGHAFVRAVAEAHSLDYPAAQDELARTGVKSVFSKPVAGKPKGSTIAVAEKTVFDNFIEDVRRTLRFYGKSTNQSFFLKIFLSGGGAAVPGLPELIHEKLNIEVGLFNPFENIAGAEKLAINSPAQFAVAVGLAIRGGLVE